MVGDRYAPALPWEEKRGDGGHCATVPYVDPGGRQRQRPNENRNWTTDICTSVFYPVRMKREVNPNKWKLKRNILRSIYLLF